MMTRMLICLSLLSWTLAAAAPVDEDHRHLRIFDIFDPDRDVCLVDSDSEEAWEECQQSKFPQCASDELICYNRRPFRNRFHADNRQPLYYIDYRNVYCYPDSWHGCSSCTPGRYCLSEKRCILDEIGYPCAKWI